MNDVCGTIDFKTQASLTPDDPEQYLLEIEGRVHTIDEKDREVELGKVTAVLVQFQKALADGVNLSHVCDSYSSELLHSYLTIFEEGDQPHEDLEIEPCFVGFLYIESLDTKPKFAEAVIETVVNTFAPSGLIAAPYDLLMVKNWEQMGFKQILTTGIVFRDQAVIRV